MYTTRPLTLYIKNRQNILLWPVVSGKRWDRWDARRPMFPIIPPYLPGPIFDILMFENLKEVCL